MKAVICDGPGGPETLRLVDLHVPIPATGQVLVRVAYATLNPLDVLIRQGRSQWMAGGWPWTPGLEYSGRVEAVGPGGDRALIGRAVVSSSEFGGCAEYALAPEAGLLALRAPLGWKAGTAWRTPALAAWFLLTGAARLQAGETVVIHSAAGPVGIMATQIARQLGARVIGLVGSPGKIDFVRPYGAEILLDYRADGWVEQVLRCTDGRGADVIVDGNGGAGSQFNPSLAAPNGRIFYLGASSGMSAPPTATGLLIAKSLSIGGFNLNSIPDAAILAAEHVLAERIAKGDWKFPVGVIAPLADTARLHTLFEARQLAGRSLIAVGGDL